MDGRGAYKDKFPDKGWEINDGAISVVRSAGAESQNGGDIVTTSEYGAIDLQFEFKLTERANGGVKYFVTESEGNKGSAIGLEYQILDDEKHPMPGREWWETGHWLLFTTSYPP